MWKAEHLFTADQKVNLCSDCANQDGGLERWKKTQLYPFWVYT